MQSLKLHGFTFGKKIGKGSFCKVMKAEYKDKKTGQITKLACKWIDKTNASKYFLEKFLSQEIKVILRICNEHPFIIEFHSILEDNRSCFIFMRRAENLDLLGYLQKHRKVSESQVSLQSDRFSIGKLNYFCYSRQTCGLISWPVLFNIFMDSTTRIVT